jgi:hypothetical protein
MPALLPVSKKAFKPLCWNDLIMLQVYSMAFRYSMLMLVECCYVHGVEVPAAIIIPTEIKHLLKWAKEET